MRNEKPSEGLEDELKPAPSSPLGCITLTVSASMFILGLGIIIYVVMALTRFTLPRQVFPVFTILPGSELQFALNAVLAISLVVSSCHIWRSRAPSS